MAIVVDCPNCRATAQVPDSAAGAKGKCRSCGSIVAVPGTVVKRCAQCGVDVAHAKRWKDAGHYFCDPCWQSRRSVNRDGNDPAEQLATMQFLGDATSSHSTESLVVQHDGDNEIADIPLASAGANLTSDRSPTVAGVQCPECHASVQVSSDGQRGKCAACGKVFRVDTALEKQNATKTCPACGETIKAIARKCRFCGELMSSDDGGCDASVSGAQPSVPTIYLVGDGRAAVSLPYDNTFALTARAFEDCGVKIKKRNPQAGELIGKSRYGANLFGMTVIAEFQSAGAEGTMVAIFARFTDAFDTVGACSAKASEVYLRLVELVQTATVSASLSRDPFAAGPMRGKSISRTRPTGPTRFFRVVAALSAIVVAAVVIATLSQSGGSGGFGSDGSLPSVSSLTFAEFDSKFSEYSNTTENQKARLLTQYKGKRVSWEGIIEGVDEDTIQVQHEATTMTFDVSLKVLKSERSRLPSLRKGDLLTYEGTIDDFGTILWHSLRDGHIVSTASLSADERTMWLMKSTTEALRPIADEAKR